jgi:K+-sensing histidine kinase KdpD
MELATAALEAEALANRVKTETMQALSHDLRTPLQASHVYYTTKYMYIVYIKLTQLAVL